MSAETQEILDIVRDHGPIDLNGIAARVTLLTDRAEIAARLFKSKSNGHVLRRADKTYVINGKNGTAQTTPPPALVEQLSKPAREHVARTGQLPELEPIPTDTPADARRAAKEHAAQVRAPRPQDALLTPDPIEAVLRDAAESAQRNLDAFTREAGDLAQIMADLIDARDKTLAALFNYRNRAA